MQLRITFTTPSGEKLSNDSFDIPANNELYDATLCTIASAINHALGRNPGSNCDIYLAASEPHAHNLRDRIFTDICNIINSIRQTSAVDVAGKTKPRPF